MSHTDHPPMDPMPNELCCCPPVARIWLETRSTAVSVENSIEMKRRLMVRSDANASVRPPGGPDTSSDGSSGSQLDEGTLKDQGKVYRTDTYVVNWQADGCGPLQVTLRVGGAVDYHGDWLPEKGSVELVANRMLEPPTYAPGPADISAVLEVRDCGGRAVLQKTAVGIPSSMP